MTKALTKQQQLAVDGETFTLGAKRDTIKVQSLVSNWLALQERIAKGEALLKELKEQAREMEWVTLPNAMTENGMKKLERADGIVIEVVSEITGSIPEKNKQEAASWLRSHGHGGILTRVLSLRFKKGDDKRAESARTLLEKKGFEVEEKVDVNHMTLKAWAREMVERGTALPTELLGIFIGQRAKIKLPKAE
jgi:hypothetical protein